MDFIADFGLPEEETRPSLRLRLDTRAYNLMYHEARKQVEHDGAGCGQVAY